MKYLPTFENFLKENVSNGVVTCSGCGWDWEISDGGNDPYICHKCGRDNESLVNEAAAYKQKEDFSGKKYGTHLAGSRIYTFKSGGHDYILDFTIDEYIPVPNKKGEYYYILRSDIRTKKKEFELVQSGAPFELISTVKDIHKLVLEDLKNHGWTVKGLKLYYSIEPGEEKNVRAVFFNRAVTSAFSDLKISYDVETSIDTRLQKSVYNYKFK
jgi:hypothetical protein